MPKDIDLDGLTIQIRKATPERYDVPQIIIRGKQAKLIFVNGERTRFYHDIVSIASMMNHEFLHWIICILSNTRGKQYDEFLKECGLYYVDILRETWM